MQSQVEIIDAQIKKRTYSLEQQVHKFDASAELVSVVNTMKKRKTAALKERSSLDSISEKESH